MLKLAEEKNIKPWVEIMPMSDCSKAVKRVEENDVKYSEFQRSSFRVSGISPSDAFCSSLLSLLFFFSIGFVLTKTL